MFHSEEPTHWTLILVVQVFGVSRRLLKVWEDGLSFKWFVTSDISFVEDDREANTRTFIDDHGVRHVCHNSNKGLGEHEKPLMERYNQMIKSVDKTWSARPTDVAF